MARIDLQNIVKRYGSHDAVSSLDLTIHDGELLVLLGPSGCGKSTTMNMIAGLTEPTSGRILFDGKDVTDTSPHERNIAMVFQSSLLYPHLTAYQNIYMSLKRSGLPRNEIEARILRAAEMVDVRRLLDKLPGQLSGGERQRVATAKAIVREPDCFLLDEPLSALDAALRMSLRAELVNLQKRFNTTMVFVTHDQVEAMTMGDRIGIMRNGKLEQIGTPEEVYNRPETLFAAGFIGSPPMNLIEGEVVAEGGMKVFACKDFRLPLAGAFAGMAPASAAVLGIRPYLMQLAGSGPGALPMKVYAIEQLGNEAIVIADTPSGARVRAVAPAGFHAQVGTVLHARFDPADALLYDPGTQRPFAVQDREAA
ncbi:ABC transporter ATP-binding protein [Mangrovicoccus sp. HB161399]|uniref:ABC transporter ATP-binding protein n=1 Tax=Mangrovicoccus sp. HB161399 TaxID=2720392 RepID=UPI001553138A|nr:ABC transporter ATP-binding protein [Mangrovicoccus sp. HB161399]